MQSIPPPCKIPTRVGEPAAFSVTSGPPEIIEIIYHGMSSPIICSFRRVLIYLIFYRKRIIHPPMTHSSKNFLFLSFMGKKGIYLSSIVMRLNKNFNSNIPESPRHVSSPLGPTFVSSL